jgi:hypothetical protein
LDSFAKIEESGIAETLQGRWLPKVISYGLYYCSKKKAEKFKKANKEQYLYHGPNCEGQMYLWQDVEYWQKAKEEFLEKASLWHGKSITDLKIAMQSLHGAMQQCQQKMLEGIEILSTFKPIYQQVAVQGGSEHLQATLESLQNRWDTNQTHLAQRKLQLDQLYDLWERRSIWTRLLLSIPGIRLFFRKQEYRKTARLLTRWDLMLEDFSDTAVEEWFQQQLKHGHQTLHELKGRIKELQKPYQDYHSHCNTLETWVAPYRKRKSLQGKTFAEQVNEINDCILRFELFKLATHYWEARWLEEVESSKPGKSIRSLPRLRHFAKLTPCFVSTFYMTPAIFSACRKVDELFNTIDLLIVDEAGQASPEIAAACFALAKRALVVGDIHQIEPIWSIPTNIDIANLKSFGLLKDKYTEEDYNLWQTRKLLASSGNLMGIAQHQCHYHQFTKLQRGLYLTEHRRCYNPIINYCNDLVYKGILEPLRGNPQHPVPWGTLSMVLVNTPSFSCGGSRENLGEAEAIANWLEQEQDNILSYARQSNRRLEEKSAEAVLAASVAIITPFKKQAELIKKELIKRELGFKKDKKPDPSTTLTIGTVHSLQGAERLLVIFSSVYGIQDKDMSKFYDKGKNMLNVAVSRAKDSFVVFGHTEVFGKPNQDSPSGILRTKLEILPTSPNAIPNKTSP